MGAAGWHGAHRSDLRGSIARIRRDLAAGCALAVHGAYESDWGGRIDDWFALLGSRLDRVAPRQAASASAAEIGHAILLRGDNPLCVWKPYGRGFTAAFRSNHASGVARVGVFDGV